MIPSSQEAHPAGHDWQFGPKNPAAQDSHDDPVNPVGHEQVPDAVQIPAPEHGGEQAADWISRTESELDSCEICARSGMESQRITRSVDDELEATAAQMLEATMIEPAENVDELIEALVSGSGVNVPEPEKLAAG